MSVSTPPPEPLISRQNLENSYPPFMPGVNFSSVYQRAGFDVCLGTPRTPRSPRSASPSSARSRAKRQGPVPWAGVSNDAPLSPAGSDKKEEHKDNDAFAPNHKTQQSFAASQRAPQSFPARHNELPASPAPQSFPARHNQLPASPAPQSFPVRHNQLAADSSTTAVASAAIPRELSTPNKYNSTPNQTPKLREHNQSWYNQLPNNRAHNFDTSFEAIQPLRISHDEGYRSKKPLGLEVCTTPPVPLLSAARESKGAPYPCQSRLETPVIRSERLSSSSSIYSARNTPSESPRQPVRISRVMSFQRTNYHPKLFPEPEPLLEVPEKDDCSDNSSTSTGDLFDSFGTGHTSLTSTIAGPNSFISSAGSSSQGSPTIGKKICRGCDQRIVGKSLRSKDGAIPGRWHRECFKCTGCRDPLGCEVLVYRDRPFCHECYLRLSEVTCQACLSPVHGDCFEAVAQPGEQVGSDQEIIRYHTDCLRCCECDCVFDSSFLLCDGRVLCGMHARSRQFMF